MAYMSYLSSSWTGSHSIKYAELYLLLVHREFVQRLRFLVLR